MVRMTPRTIRLHGHDLSFVDSGSGPTLLFIHGILGSRRQWSRLVDGRALTFKAEGDRLRDTETGSAWDALSGKAVAGPLAGQALVRVPSRSALWYAWKAQYPHTKVYGEPAP